MSYSFRAVARPLAILAVLAFAGTAFAHKYKAGTLDIDHPWTRATLPGAKVAAGYMKNWVNDEGIPGDCPWEQDIEDGRAVAKSLGIEFRVRY